LWGRPRRGWNDDGDARRPQPRGLLLELSKPAQASSALDAIVVAIDCSPASRNATALGAALAAHSGARLYLVHAVEMLAHGPPSCDELRVSESFDFARAQLDFERRSLRVPSPHAPVEAVRLGHAADEVVAYAQAKGAWLIVTGTRSEPGRHRLQEHSVAGELIALAPVPVLVVHEKPLRARTPGSPVFERPLAAVDYSESSRIALQAAALLAQGAGIDAIHVSAWDAVPPPATSERSTRAPGP